MHKTTSNIVYKYLTALPVFFILLTVAFNSHAIMFEKCFDLPGFASEPTTNSAEKVKSSASKKQQLCYTIRTIYNPANTDIASFYLKKADNRIIPLAKDVNDYASFYSVTLSEQGKYFYMEFGEEGHPYFVFYDTQAFINLRLPKTKHKEAPLSQSDLEKLHAESLAQMNKTQIAVYDYYYLGEITGFKDNGDFNFNIMSGMLYRCENDGDDDCAMQVNIFNLPD